jgi:3-hydroxypropanoate dehydrogenase
MGGKNRDKTAAAPLVAVLAADTSFHNDLPRTFPHFPGARGMFADDASRERVARFNATLQIGYFLLGVRAAGLAAGPMAGFDAAGLDEDLLAGTTLHSLLVVNIGHPGPDAWFDRLPRLETDEVVRTL